MNHNPRPPFLLHELLEAGAAGMPAKTARVTSRVRLNDGELDQLANQAASALRDMGIEYGERVALFMDNCAEAVIAFFGVLKSGAIAVPLSGLVKDRKLLRLLNDCGARALITQTRKRRVVLNAAKHDPSLPPLIWVGPSSEIPPALVAGSFSWDSWIASGTSSTTRTHSLCPPSASPLAVKNRDLAAIIYTSGTTGEPKGIMAPHGPMLAAARSIVQYLEHGPDDVLLSALPLSFSYGLYQLITSVLAGSTLVLEESFLYPVRILERIASEQVTGFPLVPTMVSMLRQLRDLDRYPLNSVRYLTSAASAMPSGHLRFLRETLPKARVFLMYGLTECVRVSYLPPREVDRRPASVGIPIPNCRVRIIKADGNPAAAGETGELLVQGPNVMRGYWNAPELTAETFRRDPAGGETWLHTGDLFSMDDEGFLTFAARRDDLIKTRGERVSPREVEQVILGLEGIRDVVVVGLPDEVLGQSIAAAVVLNRARSDAEQAIRAHCTRHLEAFMIPRCVLILDRLPLSAHGKVDRNRILHLLETASVD